MICFQFDLAPPGYIERFCKSGLRREAEKFAQSARIVKLKDPTELREKLKLANVTLSLLHS